MCLPKYRLPFCVFTAGSLPQCQWDIFNLLSQEQWIYKRAGGQAWLGYQAKIQQGLVEHKVTTVERTDGSAKTVEQVRITPKGLTKLAHQLSVGGVQ